MRSAWIGLLGISVALAGCGGGGGGGDDPAPAPVVTAPSGDFAIGAAWTALLNSGGTWTANGAGTDRNAYQFALSATKIGSGTLAGAPADRTDIAITTKRGGVSVASEVTGLLYAPASGTPLQVRYSNGDCGILSSGSAVPATARIGASGALYVSADYSGCSTVVRSGSTTSTWSLEWSGAYPVLCINSTSTRTGIEAFQALCVEVTQAGALGSRSQVTYRDMAITISPT